MPGPTGFICCCQGWSFSNLAVIGQSSPWSKKQPSSLCSSIFLLEDKHRDVWAVPSGIRDICLAKQTNKLLIISHLIVDQTAAMFKFKMKKHLYHTETYSPMADQHYCLRRGKIQVFSYNKEGKKLLTSCSLSKTTAPFTASGINGKKVLRLQSDLGVLKSPNKQKRGCSTGGRNPLLKVCHVSACWV